MEQVLDFYEKQQNWQEACEICRLAKGQFLDKNLAEKADTLLKRYQEKLQQREEEINLQAQRLIQRALQFEEKKDYAQAVDTYYRILNNPTLQATSTAKEITLPLVVETTPPSLRCYNDEEFIGTSPIVYRYPPEQFPFIRAVSRGMKEYQRQTIRTNSNYIWKIHIVLR
jgi:hypothetical protein